MKQPYKEVFLINFGPYFGASTEPQGEVMPISLENFNDLKKIYSKTERLVSDDVAVELNINFFDFVRQIKNATSKIVEEVEDKALKVLDKTGDELAIEALHKKTKELESLDDRNPNFRKNWFIDKNGFLQFKAFLEHYRIENNSDALDIADFRAAFLYSLDRTGYDALSGRTSSEDILPISEDISSICEDTDIFNWLCLTKGLTTEQNNFALMAGIYRHITVKKRSLYQHFALDLSRFLKTIPRVVADLFAIPENAKHLSEILSKSISLDDITPFAQHLAIVKLLFNGYFQAENRKSFISLMKDENGKNALLDALESDDREKHIEKLLKIGHVRRNCAKPRTRKERNEPIEMRPFDWWNNMEMSIIEELCKKDITVPLRNFFHEKLMDDTENVNANAVLFVIKNNQAIIKNMLTLSEMYLFHKISPTFAEAWLDADFRKKFDSSFTPELAQRLNAQEQSEDKQKFLEACSKLPSDVLKHFVKNKKADQLKSALQQNFKFADGEERPLHPHEKIEALKELGISDLATLEKFGQIVEASYTELSRTTIPNLQDVITTAKTKASNQGILVNGNQMGGPEARRSINNGDDIPPLSL